MAVKIEGDIDEGPDDELDDELHEETEADDPEQDAEQTDSEPETDDEDDADEVSISFGEVPANDDDEPDPENVKPWVSKIREQQRETARENRELKKQLAALQQPVVEKPLVKPTLGDCDYDPDKFEAALLAFADRDRAAKEVAAKAQEAVAAKVAAYNTGKAALRVKDFAAAEDVVVNTLTIPQQNHILKLVPNPAAFVYALAQDGKALAKLASITDGDAFGHQLGIMEGKLTIAPKKKPQPEMRPSGSGTKSVANSALERARAKAEQSGDLTEVMRLKSQLRAAAK